jgi:hypothetical protein
VPAQEIADFDKLSSRRWFQEQGFGGIVNVVNEQIHFSIKINQGLETKM